MMLRFFSKEPSFALVDIGVYGRTTNSSLIVVAASIHAQVERLSGDVCVGSVNVKMLVS